MSATETITASRAVCAFGYPKSGCTWLARLLADILDCSCAGFYGAQEVDEVARCNLDKSGDTTVLKGHWPSTIVDHPEYHTPEDVIRIKMSDVVYIVRDPRDIVVSMSDFYGYSIDETILIMSQAKNAQHVMGFKTWDKHVASWLYVSGDRVDLPTIIRYESLLKFPLACLAEVIARLGYGKEKMRRIKGAIERQSFATRKANPKNELDDLLLRKGISGDYVKRLTQEQKNRVVELFGETMMALGYDHSKERRTR